MDTDRKGLRLSAHCLCFLLGACVFAGAAASTAFAQESAEAAASEANRPVRRITVGQAAVLGVVEGLTEYLPVSSTGHLILAGHAMDLTHFSSETGRWGHKLEKAPAFDAFAVVIQLGAILAVLGLYRRRVSQMARGLAGRDPRGRHLLGVLLLAFLPAAVVGYLFQRRIEEELFGPIPVVIAMAVGGVLMIVIEHFFWTRRGKTQARTSQVDALTYGQALAIGLAQCLAMWPGTSRSMITILAGLVVGLDMVAAAEFSFLLALPTLGAATVYSGLKHRQELLASTGVIGLAMGLLVSAIVAAVAVDVFVKWLTRHGMKPFGVYRILAAAVLYAYFATR